MVVPPGPVGSGRGPMGALSTGLRGGAGLSTDLASGVDVGGGLAFGKCCRTTGLGCFWVVGACRWWVLGLFSCRGNSRWSSDARGSRLLVLP